MLDKTSEEALHNVSVAERLWQKVRECGDRRALRREVELRGSRWDTLYRQLRGKRRLTADQCATVGSLLKLDGNWILYGVGVQRSTIKQWPEVASPVVQRLSKEIGERSHIQRGALIRGAETRGYKRDTLFHRKLRGRRRLTADECAMVAGLLHLDGNWVLYDVGPRRTSMVALYLGVMFDEPGDGPQVQRSPRDVRALGPAVIGMEQWEREEAIRLRSPDAISHRSLGPTYRPVACRYCHREFRQHLEVAMDPNSWGPSCCPDCFEDRVTTPRRREELELRRRGKPPQPTLA